ncbi:hypothetical protein PROSTU_04761 [Providencia stuartii ATCC 25827]|uniref:Uncharacterized protein n=1 Tax=Providencia stuartii ATCC 25827 TaxID=471874 RepID=A0AA86YEG9_PROST|nr:hypothetical protein PROSTU_04761 [Providencia stuartii ATCC 25827]
MLYYVLSLNQCLLIYLSIGVKSNFPPTIWQHRDLLFTPLKSNLNIVKPSYFAGF